MCDSLRGGLMAALAALALVPAAAPADDGPRYAEGSILFQANCAVCHRANGAGNPGLAPPVTVSAPCFIEMKEGRRQLAMTVLYGMYGDIVVGERHYNFKMPEFTRFDDATLAAVLNFVVFDLGHARAEAAPIDAAEIAAERSKAIDGAQVRAHRLDVLSGLPP